MAGKVKVKTWKLHELNPLCLSLEKWHGALISDSLVFKSSLCHLLAGQADNISLSASIRWLPAIKTNCGYLEQRQLTEWTEKPQLLTSERADAWALQSVHHHWSEYYSVQAEDYRRGLGLTRPGRRAGCFDCWVHQQSIQWRRRGFSEAEAEQKHWIVSAASEPQFIHL